ncbi:MAG TPA: lipoprotein insertase outer membrane protein LolB [Pseudomonadales bacterium]|nr:lipoprotein insertase outer membrane protein LolB [Pseudomonadales bacterium]
MTRALARTVLVLSIVVLLAACATRPVVEQTGNANDAIWSLQGRLGISAGRKHGSFTVDWRQRKDDYNIDLLGPLGVGVAKITRRAGKVTLEIPHQAPLVADSADRLLSDSLGLDIPVTPLRYWIRGKPAPGSYQPTPEGFRQQGWTIAYAKYEAGLPVKIQLTRPEVRVTMVVRKWTD